jgi:hypothetical protein
MRLKCPLVKRGNEPLNLYTITPSNLFKTIPVHGSARPWGALRMLYHASAEAV